MDKLNLPIIEGDMPLPRSLSMDEYAKFVEINLRYTVDREAVREQKKLAMVNVCFSLEKS